MKRQETAETIALQALTWLAGNEDVLQIFLGASGASASDLAAGAHRPEFLGSVLDFLLMDDAWIVAFCDSVGLAYDAPMQARVALPGGEAEHWT
ncbi:MAG: DUF3572 domain-containing protein [Paracoccaceae bacterium]|nr:DUF3572 domain-containing protein [Paracoccaceae bacterium]